MHSHDSRIYAFDWLRIIAFGLLNFYHSIQPYNPSSVWHVSDANTSDRLWAAFGWVRRWRLHLLFFVTGFGTYFALRKLDGASFCKESVTRLGVPLVFGMLVVCPPQTWIERISQHQHLESYWTFYLTDFLTSYPYPNGNISWTHLWFLLLKTLLLSPLLIWLRDSRWRCSYMRPL